MHYHTEYPEEVLQTAEPPVGDHLKCKDLVDAYEKWSLKQESNHRWCLLRRGPNTSTFWKRIQLFPERLLQKMCMWQSQKVIWDMINSLFPTLQLSTYFCCFSLALANISPWPLMPFFQIFLKNSEIKTAHNTFRDCRVHFFWQPFSK